MSTATYPVPPHGDPEWWKRWPPVIVMAACDICTYCGHRRDMHSTATGCTARSASIVGHPDPCECSNRRTGGLYHRIGY